MVDNGMNVNGNNHVVRIGHSESVTNNKPSEQEKIVIDFKTFDQDGDLHVTVDEVLRHQIDVYNKTGALPEGKTVAEFLMDIQKAVEKHAGDDKQLNIDEYGAVVKSGVEMSRPSEEAKESHGVYSEWMEVDENGNVSFGAEYSPRAEANQKQINEITEMKKQSQEKTENIEKDSKEPKQYRAEDEKSTDARKAIEVLQKQLQGPNTPDGHKKIQEEIAFYQSVLDSNGYAP